MAPALAACQVGNPIETRNFRTLSLPFLRFNPRADVVGLGESNLSFGLTMANELRKDVGVAGTVSEDCETTQLLAKYRRGIGEGLDLTLELPLVARGGGILDPLIQFWHRHIVNFDDPLRDATPYGGSSIMIPGHAEFGSAGGIGDVSAVVTKKFGSSTLAYVGVKAPTGSASKLIGSGAWDVGIGVQHTIQVNDRWRALAQVGYIAQGAATELPGSRSSVFQYAASFMYSANSRDTWVFQLQGEDAAIVTGVDGSDATHRIATFGFNRRLDAKRSLELFFSENGDFLSVVAKNGPDFTLGARLTTKF